MKRGARNLEPPLRIVAGEFKGRALAAPPGRVARPTAERAREAVFNILEHAHWALPLAEARVLDLFAGTGALGFEALSRGAPFALFVETDAGARGAIRETVEALGLFARTRIHRRNGADLGLRPAGLGAPFSLVFLDPPYGQGLAPRALAGLRAGAWLAPDARLVVEIGARESLEAPGFTRLDERVYGAARVVFLSNSAAERASP
jgi:16S rRNA (guanine966-N2)-methyltransferase